MQDRIERPGPFTFDDFVAFLEEHPDEERWELIDGEFELNASPSNLHQIVTGNLVYLLGAVVRERKTDWMVLPGLGIHDAAQPRWAPVPDVIIRPRSTGQESFCDDAIAVVEILSPSTKRKDLVRKRSYYCGLAAMQHYGVVTPDELLVRIYSREAGWQERIVHLPEHTVDLTAIDVRLPVAEIYRDTGLV